MENIKIIKILGSGMFGTTYKVKKNSNNKIYALKRQKILKSFITKNTKYYMWRELYFYSWINKLSISDQKFFMKMIDYKFYSNCQYFNPQSEKPNNKIIQKLIKSKHCLDLLLDLKDGIVSDLLSKSSFKSNNKQFYSMIIQCSYICYLMNKSSYSHNDLHYGNIAYVKVPKNSMIKMIINGKNYFIKSYGYQFSAIDYGLILHKKFILTTKENKTYKNDMTYNKDMKSIFIYCLTNLKKCFKKSYKKEKKLLLNTLHEEKPELYLRIKYLILFSYPEMIKYYDKFELDGSINKLLYYEIIQYLAIYDIKLISKCFTRKAKLSSLNSKEFRTKEIIKPNNISNQHLEFFKFNINDHLTIIKYFSKLL
jgi:hypothetical protein